MTTALPSRRWWHLAWSLPVAALVSLPAYAIALLSFGVNPPSVGIGTTCIVVISVLFYLAGLPVRQRSIGRRHAVAGVTGVGGLLLTVGAVAVVV